jgi:predicted metal-dependent phosphoesterase TrpH
MRADLHLHSYHSGYASHLRFLRARDCYSEPDAIYAVAKSRGMDLVTITDHDSIDGCLEFLDRHPNVPDFFISEEIECRFPDTDLRVHIGAYDVDEETHRKVQPLRGNVFEAAAYLQSRGVFYAFNHPLFFFRGQVPLTEYLRATLDFPAWEVRNGTMLAEHNALAAAIAGRANADGRAIAMLGGSDSHTLSGIGTTYTEAPGSTREDFFGALRGGLARPGGVHGTAWREAREIYSVIANYWMELVGARRHDLSALRRTLGLAFSLVSLPFEFFPMAAAVMHKRDERARVAAFAREWASAVHNAAAFAAARGPMIAQSAVELPQ